MATYSKDRAIEYDKRYREWWETLKSDETFRQDIKMIFPHARIEDIRVEFYEISKISLTGGESNVLPLNHVIGDSSMVWKFPWRVYVPLGVYVKGVEFYLRVTPSYNRTDSSGYELELAGNHFGICTKNKNLEGIRNFSIVFCIGTKRDTLVGLSAARKRVKDY